MTKRLFDLDSHLREFTAAVLSCERSGDIYHTILDQTAFFPEGGGQPADTGTLGGVRVLDVHEKAGVILHYTDAPLPVGSTATGILDWEPRLRRMQNHSGEHIVSGLVYREFGYANVGFHIGSRDVTLDFDGVLDREALRRIEYLANCAVAENIPVRAWYPTAQELAALPYRSKLDLTENVRIVEFAGYDRCACCAPHVNYSGEIGMIKLLDFIRYKGGVRIHMLCGLDALRDYNEKYDNVAAIGAMLSVQQKDAYSAVCSLSDTLAAQKQRIAALNRELVQAKIAALPAGEGGLLLFEPSLDIDSLRALASAAAKLRSAACGVCAGNDGEGYQFAVASRDEDLRELAKDLRTSLNARGGGSAEMIQGSIPSSAKEIRAFFAARGIEAK